MSVISLNPVVDRGDAALSSDFNLKSHAENRRLADEAAAFKAAHDRRIAAEAGPELPKAPLFAETAASVAHLVDPEPERIAREDYAAVNQRHVQNNAAIRTAEQSLKAAQAAQAELAAAGARGENVPARKAVEARQAVRDAEHLLEHLLQVGQELTPVWRQAHDAVSAARGLAYMPVLEHGINLRIAAAAKLDAARVAMADAEALFTVACDVMAHALSNGARVPHRPHIGAGTLSTKAQSEARERAFWGRSASSDNS